MTKYFLLSLLFILSNVLSAQEVEFGKVSKQELQETSYPYDESAHAAVLYRSQVTYLESNGGDASLITQIHERIKIYDKEGFDYATEQINLFKTRRSQETVSKIKAVTYNLENGKVVSQKLEKDQIFDTEISYNYKQVKFTMPNVKVGSVIEFKYQIRSPYIWNIDEFRFQYDIPVKIVDAEIRTPAGFKFRATHRGHVSFVPKQSEKIDHRLGMSVSISNYHLENIPALKEESYVDNINNYRAGVSFEMVSIERPGYFKSLSMTWKDVAQTIGNYDDYKNQLDQTKSFDDEVDALLKDAPEDPIEKMELIFSYVKDNITWNGIDGKGFYNGLKKTLKEKKGNAADINLLLVCMLRYAGIKANPVIISTKDNLIPIFPTVDRLNYVLAYAIIDDKEYFMDATEEYSDINILPLKDYNWSGIYIDNENLIWKKINITEPKPSQSMYVVNSTLNEDGELEGSLKSRFVNHAAYDYRNSYKNADLDTYISGIETKYEGIEISDFENKNTDTHKGYVSESFNFFSDNMTETLNDKMYFKPFLFFALESNPFKEEERKYPIDFGVPLKQSYNINIQVPESYTIESAPESALLKLPDNLGEFKFLTNIKGNNIQISISMEIKEPYLSPDKYLILKDFFNAMISKEAEQVVLAKI